jgi:hypothetical protein
MIVRYVLLPHLVWTDVIFSQDIVKALFADKAFNAKHRLGAVNSINWARILAQQVYYFLSYFHFQAKVPAADDIELQYVVPTGNFGDILAGYYAKKMGLPIGKLAVATNENDILARFWRSGKYEKVDSSSASTAGEGSDASGVKETLSPAMDILISSNFERLLWYLAHENAEGAGEAKREAASRTLDGWMSRMKSDGRVEVPVQVLETARKDFVAERISDDLVRSVPLFMKSSRKSDLPILFLDTENHQIVFRRKHRLCIGPTHRRWARSGSYHRRIKVSPMSFSEFPHLVFMKLMHISLSHQPAQRLPNRPLDSPPCQILRSSFACPQPVIYVQL